MESKKLSCPGHRKLPQKRKAGLNCIKKFKLFIKAHSTFNTYKLLSNLLPNAKLFKQNSS